MENHIETNFREIQKILDSCVSHGYKTKVDALFLKPCDTQLSNIFCISLKLVSI